MNETIVHLLFIVTGIIFIFYGGKGEKYNMAYEGRPLVIKIGNHTLPLFRVFCVFLGVLAIVIGVSKLL